LQVVDDDAPPSPSVPASTRPRRAEADDEPRPIPPYARRWGVPIPFRSRRARPRPSSPKLETSTSFGLAVAGQTARVSLSIQQPGKSFASEIVTFESPARSSYRVLLHSTLIQAQAPHLHLALNPRHATVKQDLSHNQIAYSYRPPPEIYFVS
jgi:hypothetical protein